MISENFPLNNLWGVQGGDVGETKLMGSVMGTVGFIISFYFVYA